MALYLLTRIIILYRMCVAKLHPMHTMLMLVMNHIYMMIKQNVSLTNLLFLILQSDKPKPYREGVKTQREPHMVYRFLL